MMTDTRPGPAVTAPEAPLTLSTVTDERWNSVLSVSARTAGSPAAEAFLGKLLATEADRLEAAASRFRDDSELSSINAAPGQWTDVSWYFVTVLTAAITAAEASEGLVDPCVGALVDAAGYRMWRDGGDWDGSARDQAPSTGLWQHIEIRPSGTRARVRIPAGCQLDLGAVAKAWLADRIAERVADQLGVDVVANMGGDLRAIGRDLPWTLGADAEIAGLAPAAIDVTGGGLATSGRGRRSWVTPDGPAHHIIDPRTGRCADTRWWAVSVLAATAAGANTASTAAMILDDAAPAWLAERHLDALLVSWAAGGRPSTLPVGNWPREPDHPQEAGR